MSESEWIGANDQRQKDRPYKLVRSKIGIAQARIAVDVLRHAHIHSPPDGSAFVAKMIVTID